MPRIPRMNQIRWTNTHHVILRSINHQDIFYDDLDRKKFLKTIIKTKEKYEYELYAYVLMENHIHVLLNDNQNNLSKIIQSLATSYAIYFNKKYDRIGHVFYNRFKSKNIETEMYFLRTLRYIHFNPEKTGICSFEKYEWSSYLQYFKQSKIIDQKTVIQLFENNLTTFKEFHNEYRNSSAQICLDSVEMEENNKAKMTDDVAIQKIKEHLNINNLVTIQNYNRKKRDEIIKEISTIEKIERKQLARILGLNERTIYRAINNK